jgi:hypothetical protein
MSRFLRGLRVTPSLAIIAAAALAGCGRDERVVDAGPGQPPIDPRPVAPAKASPMFRLGARTGSPLEWSAPAGWQELPEAQMREVGYQVGGDPNAECTLAVYGGASGGVLANVNRWRKQMSLEPIDEAALAALPRKSIMGGDGTLVELTGRYVGMGGTKDVPDAKLVGVVRTLPQASVFVKLVGPARVVEAEAARFDAFCASIWMPGAPEGAATPAPEPLGHPSIATSPVARPRAAGQSVAGSRGEAGGLRWSWPAGWTKAESDRPMRAATFLVEGAPGTDVAVTILPGDAGGLAANINRWRGQMGQPALSEAELAALPRVASLGTQAVVVSIDGTFKSMSGERTEHATFVGAVIERESDVVFVKVTGPSSEVAKVRPGFDAFLTSLEGGAK